MKTINSTNRDYPIHDRRAVAALIDAILAQPNLSVSVFDGEEWTLKRSTSTHEIAQACMSTDDDRLNVWRTNGDGTAERAGWFHLVYGNGEGETIADNADNAFCNDICGIVEAAFN